MQIELEGKVIIFDSEEQAKIWFKVINESVELQKAEAGVWEIKNFKGINSTAKTQDTTFIVCSRERKYCTACGADIKLEGEFDYCPYCSREVEDFIYQGSEDMEIKTVERIEKAKVYLGMREDINDTLHFELVDNNKALEISYCEEGEKLGGVKFRHKITKSSVDKLVDLLLKFYNNMGEM
jgi:hypothetical protein